MTLSRRHYLQLLGAGAAGTVTGCLQGLTDSAPTPSATYIPAPITDGYTRNVHTYVFPKQIQTVLEATSVPAFGTYSQAFDAPVSVQTSPFTQTTVDSYTWGDVDWYLSDGAPQFKVYSNTKVMQGVRTTLESSDWQVAEPYRGFDLWQYAKTVYALKEDVAIFVNGNLLQKPGQPTAHAIIDAAHNDTRFSTTNTRYGELCQAVGDGQVGHLPGGFQDPISAPERAYLDGLIGFGQSITVTGDRATVVRAVAYERPTDVAVDALESHVHNPERERAKRMYAAYDTLEVTQAGGVAIITGTLPSSDLTQTTVYTIF